MFTFEKEQKKKSKGLSAIISRLSHCLAKKNKRNDYLDRWIILSPFYVLMTDTCRNIVKLNLNDNVRMIKSFPWTFVGAFADSVAGTVGIFNWSKSTSIAGGILLLGFLLLLSTGLWLLVYNYLTQEGSICCNANYRTQQN